MITTDLSQLSFDEQRQFDEDMSVLLKGSVDVCLYLRYSSEKQSDQSIEGQLRDCRAYCKSHDYRIAAIYVDRATSASKSTERRQAFQAMIEDSSKKRWTYVVVWKLDRFARNRTDSAVYKMKLKKYGVKVLSATEAISDNPEGIILEAVLEGIAEYYSAELSQKTSRGMRETALKAQSTGGCVPLGYKVENKKYVIDPPAAVAVREAFEAYAAGETVAAICEGLNAKGFRSAKGSEFNKNSFKKIFSNRKYIGEYRYGDITIPDAMPRIIDDATWNAVQKRLSKRQTRGKARVHYILQGKVFCGHCGNLMRGDTGTSASGTIYNYYSCATHRLAHTCDKKPVPKDVLETAVAKTVVSKLNDEMINELADMAVRQAEYDRLYNSRIPELEAALAETQRSIDNLTTAIEQGVISQAVVTRLNEAEKKLTEIGQQLVIEKAGFISITKEQVVYWLSKFKDGDVNDKQFKQSICDLLVNSVTVWDEPDGFKVTIALNLTDTPTETLKISSANSPAGHQTYTNTNKIVIIRSLALITIRHTL